MNSSGNMNNEIQDKVFNFIYDMALRDAVLQRAYEGEKKHLFENTDARKITREYIDKVLSGEKPDFYDAAIRVEQAFDEKEFSFGNAQKLINMSAKYMYISAYKNENYADFREKFSECHCPMDSIMIEKIIEEIEKLQDSSDKKSVENLVKEKYKMRDEGGKERKWTVFLRQPWSRIPSGKDEQYIVFQDIVKHLAKYKGLIPIEYDYIEWNSDNVQNAL